MDTKVTVLMAVYNGERFLRESIDSILNQTYKEFEFLIINDGSTDSSREIILSCFDSRIRLVDNAQNIGLTRSLNKGLKLAKGEYIARMDADDISLPDRLNEQVIFLDAHSEVGILGTNCLIIDERGDELGEIIHLFSHEQIMSQLLLDNRFVHSSVMLRKKVLNTTGYYDECLELAQDYGLFLSLSTVTQLANLPQPLHKWRKNDSTGISIVKRSEQILVRDRIRRTFLEKHFAVNKEYVNLVLANFCNNPKDTILFEYLRKLSKVVPLLSSFFICKLKIIYYMTRWGWAQQHRYG